MVANQLLQNAQAGAGSGRVAPPMHIPPAGNAANNTFSRNNYRRVAMPIHQYVPSTTGSTAGYNGAFNNYPYRPYMNMTGYNPYGSYGQPANNYQNP